MYFTFLHPEKPDRRHGRQGWQYSRTMLFRLCISILLWFPMIGLADSADFGDAFSTNEIEQEPGELRARALPPLNRSSV